jgi:hypothetical protein
VSPTYTVWPWQGSDSELNATCYCCRVSGCNSWILASFGENFFITQVFCYEKLNHFIFCGVTSPECHLVRLTNDSYEKTLKNNQ